MNDHDIIKKIFQYKTIAVVGFSPKRERPSHFVSMYMKNNGYNIIPVNPGHRHIEGMRCYPDLESIDETIDIVNIFRRSEYVSDIVKSAILIESKVIWMQNLIFHEESAKNAKKAGMLVVMNNCMLRQHKQINLL